MNQRRFGINDSNCLRIRIMPSAINKFKVFLFLKALRFIARTRAVGAILSLSLNRK
jgi:hypothetical protein